MNKRKYSKLITSMKHSNNNFFDHDILQENYCFTDGRFSLFTSDPETITYFLENAVPVRRENMYDYMHGLLDKAEYGGILSADIKEIYPDEIITKGGKVNVYYIDHDFSFKKSHMGKFAVINPKYMPNCNDNEIYINAENPLSGALYVRSDTDQMIIMPFIPTSVLYNTITEIINNNTATLSVSVGR